MVDLKHTIRVMVYGTLKKDQPLHRLLDRGKEVTYVGRDYIEEPLMLADMGAFPALLRDDYDPTSGYKVFGEVYAVDPETLASLDFAEGHPNFFKREKVTTKDKQLKVWVYVLSDSAADYADDWIEQGVWQPTDKEAEYVRSKSDSA